MTLYTLSHPPSMQLEAMAMIRKGATNILKELNRVRARDNEEPLKFHSVFEVASFNEDDDSEDEDEGESESEEF
ncbi:hypothetical protein L1987_06394 [Smallanthus sonchifolius]|uniref:Uncharacterized protein n=1 Tax=Smallanthus sonchifolius TaxID=185202 RepID=A0ACB9JY63_9ASTR|nr:hypothetical protein L1987_06394 [Smallanthus sonchifolius]